MPDFPEGLGGGNVNLLIWGPQGPWAMGLLQLVSTLPTGMMGFHSDCGAAGFKAVSLYHYTVIDHFFHSLSQNLAWKY